MFKIYSIFLYTILSFSLYATNEIRCGETATVCVTENETPFSFLESYFNDISKDKIHLSVLNGGLSGTAMYKVSVNDKQYVLRVHQSVHLNPQDEREHEAIISAAKMGIAPQVLYVSPDGRAILMEFISRKTISLEEAKNQENCVKIAHAIRRTHQISTSLEEGESLFSKGERCYKKVLNDGLAPKEEITGAIELLRSLQTQLSHHQYQKVSIHGDLNARNIFITENGVLFIDWAETNLDDPFHDLAYFSLQLDYNQAEENCLLYAYLNRLPTPLELERFELRKRINLAFWSLTNLYLADAQIQKYPQNINVNAPLKSWNFYQKAFAESPEELTAQHFYEFSRLNYQRALSL